jgi:phage-related protein
MSTQLPPKPLEWMGSSRQDLIAFPPQVRKALGYALYLSQIGDKAPAAKPLKGFGSARVLEVVADHESSAFRAVYTVRFAKAVYVLHAFQKKSMKGRATPKPEMNLIQQRLKAAAEHYQQHYPDKP